jgi:hypothetical protein
MPGRHDDAQAASKTGLFSRWDFFDFDAVRLDPAREVIEIGLARNLDPA